jgi:hypothetical protein
MDQYDLVAHLYRQRAFSRATFGPGDRTLGVTDHILKEVEEVRKAKAKTDAANEVLSGSFQMHSQYVNASNLANKARQELIFEWVDLVLLSLDGLWRTGASIEEAVEMIRAKQEKNENRNWPDWRTAAPDQAIQHVKD